MFDEPVHNFKAGYDYAVEKSSGDKAWPAAAFCMKQVLEGGVPSSIQARGMQHPESRESTTNSEIEKLSYVFHGRMSSFCYIHSCGYIDALYSLWD